MDHTKKHTHIVKCRIFIAKQFSFVISWATFLQNEEGKKTYVYFLIICPSGWLNRFLELSVFQTPK